MRREISLLLFSISLTAGSAGWSQQQTASVFNRAPLSENPYALLPLGTIRPQGMLLTMLEIQREGLTGHLDSIYRVVCGPDNGWLGGPGDGWERGPYWIDGLLPLAYQLNDKALQRKAQEWVEWSITHQRKDGYFGPRPLEKGYPVIPGTQQGNREDWWPKMVMLKVLQQYYLATGDERVIDLMTRYFRYQLEQLPSHPLNHWTFWGNRRGADNLAVVYWLYNRTGEEFLLELGELIHYQTLDWAGVFTSDSLRTANPPPYLHCVNVAQGVKAPVIYYQQRKDPALLESVKTGLASIRDVYGFVTGMYGADEYMHSNNPIHGSEFCSAVELMFSLESILPITGDPFYADYLEKVAYNVLPTQHTDDFDRRQYFQQTNQVKITMEERVFYDDRGTRTVFGTTTGYPCCLANMHQGWPKLIQNLWYASRDGGLAALIYGPCEVTARVGNGKEVTIREETGYPFDDRIQFTFLMENENGAGFPLHLRVPGWCQLPFVHMNGERIEVEPENGIIILERNWKTGDTILLELPMKVRLSYWYEGSVGIERGPLVYALGISEQWEERRREGIDDTYWEVLPRSDWNFAIPRTTAPEEFIFTMQKKENFMPWNLENAPVSLKVNAYRWSGWTLYRGSTDKVPASRHPAHSRISTEATEIELVPYGCTTLRIAQFPVCDLVPIQRIQ